MITTAEKIIKKLKRSGFEAYFAGGSVRDMLMGLNPKDVDIATSAKPNEIEELLNKTIPIGKKFGVILAVEDGHNFEIASFRSDSGYSDGRRPDYITFTDAKEDALRRDFTINGIFYDPLKKDFLDFVGGKNDIATKTLRFIGNPNERIKEDSLRILRAIRFKNTFNLTYEKDTWDSICQNKHLLKNISAERIKDELNKMLDGKFRNNSLEDLEKSGILGIVIPELEKCKGVKQGPPYHKEGDVFTHSLKAVGILPPKAPLFLVWTVLLHDIGKPDTYVEMKDRIHFNAHAPKSAELANNILKRLKFPNIEINTILWLVKNHMTVGDIPKMRLAKRRLFLLDPKTKWLLLLHKADALGSEPADLSLYKKITQMLREEKGKKIPKPILSGDDIIKILDIKSGPKVGRLLKKVYEAQIEGKIKTKKEAIEYIKKARS